MKPGELFKVQPNNVKKVLEHPKLKCDKVRVTDVVLRKGYRRVGARANTARKNLIPAEMVSFGILVVLGVLTSRMALESNTFTRTETESTTLPLYLAR